MRIMRVYFFLLMLFFLAAVAMGQEYATAGRGHSQIVRALKADTIVVAEVIYVGEPVSSPFVVEPIGTQIIVYKPIEVIKGNMRDREIAVAVPVYLQRPEI